MNCNPEEPLTDEEISHILSSYILAQKEYGNIYSSDNFFAASAWKLVHKLHVYDLVVDKIKFAEMIGG